MNDDATTNPAAAPPWPAPWWPRGAAWPSFAPQQLQQPINPGWSFGNLVSVTTLNSSAPDVERAVVSEHSYGRQIGRIGDALCAVLEALPTLRDDERVRGFVALAAQVEAIKRAASRSRVERLREDLEALQREDPQAFAALAALLARPGPRG